MADYDSGSGLTEREEARERLKASLDALAERASLQVQMQKEPVKMLGGASAVGAVIGLVIGRQFRRSKKIYVDAASPEKHQKALVKAQSAQKGGGGVGGALIATLGTLAVKTLTDRVLAPKLEELAQNLLEKSGEEARSPSTQSRAGQPKQIERSSSAGPSLSKPAAPALAADSSPRPMGTASSGSATTNPSATARFLKSAQVTTQATDQAGSFNVQADAAGSAPPIAASHEHPGVVPTPRSVVEAKAQGSAIAPEEKGNPNLR